MARVPMPRETRAQARERIAGDLMAAARRQLGEVGAPGLSLRAVAREIGMVSSAVYRYVDSRDELLTRLITEAYDSLGNAAEAASADAVSARPDDDLNRWLAIAGSVRRWALEKPHEYLLIYGSPVPGYAAPESTIAPGTRVTFALVAVLADASAAGRLQPAAGPEPELDAELTADFDALTKASPDPIPTSHVLAFLVAWTQMFGLIGFELTSQTRGVVTDHQGLFEAAAFRLGHQLGLRDRALPS